MSNFKLVSAIHFCTLATLSLTNLDGCTRTDTESKLNDRAKQEANEKQELVQFAQQNNAVLDWEKDLIPGLQDPVTPRTIEIEPVYSIDMQRVLIRSGAIAFTATFKDVARTDAGFRCTLGYPEFDSSIVFLLEASKDQVDAILAHRPRIFDKVAVAAHIDSVQRSNWAAACGEPEDNSCNLNATLDAPFVAKGVLVSLMVLPK